MSVLTVLELLGVFVFALSGASLAVEKQLDLFGVLVLAVVTALGGGLLRDVLLGDTPPVALRESRYLVVALVAGAVVFLGSSLIEPIATPVLVFDAAGLGLFVATGTAKALHAGMGAVPAITLGCLTGIGGGMARDVLVGVVPVVLRRELYAVPAVVGAAVVTVGDGVGAPGAATAGLAAVVVLIVRVVAVWRDWHFPIARR